MTWLLAIYLALCDDERGILEPRLHYCRVGPGRYIAIARHLLATSYDAIQLKGRGFIMRAMRWRAIFARSYSQEHDHQRSPAGCGRRNRHG